MTPSHLVTSLLSAVLSAVLLAVGLGQPPAGARTVEVAAAAASAPVWLTSGSTWVGLDQTSSSPRTRVVDLAFAQHDDFDRVVIKVRGPLPGGTATYQRTFTYDGSGLPVPIKGRSGLQVTLTPAYGHTASGANTYVGTKLARPGFETLKALAFTGDFEGQVGFAFALKHRAAYRVFTLESPRRIVVDFAHQS